MEMTLTASYAALFMNLQWRSTPALIRGALLYEGYTSGSVTPPAGKFVAYMSGAYGNATLSAFYNTTGAPSSPSCTSFSMFPTLDHYGITNYQLNSPSQTVPCGAPNKATPANYTITRQAKEQAQEAIAQLSDATVRFNVFNDASARAFLRSLPSQRVSQYLTKQCSGL
jgi:hypothetical protein